MLSWLRRHTFQPKQHLPLRRVCIFFCPTRVAKTLKTGFQVAHTRRPPRCVFWPLELLQLATRALLPGYWQSAEIRYSFYSFKKKCTSNFVKLGEVRSL